MRGKKEETKIGKLGALILLSVQKYSNNKLLSQHLKKSRGYISKQTTKLQKLGLLEKERLFNISKFVITNKGKKAVFHFLGVSEKEKQQIRLHNFSVIMKILRLPTQLEKKLLNHNWIEYNPKNWRAYKKKIEGLYVLWTPKTVQIPAIEVYANTISQAYSEALQRVLLIKQHLEEDYKGLLLGQPEELAYIASQHVAKLYDPLAVSAKLAGYKYKSNRLHIDESKGIPELETVHKIYAKDDMYKITEMYEDIIRGNSIKNISYTLAQLANLQETQTNQMGMFARAMSEHVKLVQALRKNAEVMNHQLAVLEETNFKRFKKWIGEILIGKKDKTKKKYNSN